MRRDPERKPDDRDPVPEGAVRRIMWRRRAWGWIAVLGLAGFLILGIALLIGLSTPGGGWAGTVQAADAAEVLAVAVGAGTLGAIGESVLLSRQEQGRRASLPGRGAPVPWLLVLGGLAITAGLLVFPVAVLPQTVNAWGYAVGAEPPATFVAWHPSQYCSSDDSGSQDCSWTTGGYLEPGRQYAIWTGYLAPGQARQVSRPLWDWLQGDRLFGGPGDVIAVILGGFFVGGGLLLAGLVVAGGSVAFAVGLVTDGG
jgi:hypothetical protein